MKIHYILIVLILSLLSSKTNAEDGGNKKTVYRVSFGGGWGFVEASSKKASTIRKGGGIMVRLAPPYADVTDKDKTQIGWDENFTIGYGVPKYFPLNVAETGVWVTHNFTNDFLVGIQYNFIGIMGLMNGALVYSSWYPAIRYKMIQATYGFRPEGILAIYKSKHDLPPVNSFEISCDIVKGINIGFRQLGNRFSDTNKFKENRFFVGIKM